MEHSFVDNKEAKQYELHIGEKKALIEYILVKDKIYLTHTEVPPSLTGNGYGSEIIRRALEDIRDRDLTLVPLCPFVALYIKRNPEWRSLVLKGVKIA